jgi:uncharacterized protein YkwD
MLRRLAAALLVAGCLGPPLAPPPAAPPTLEREERPRPAPASALYRTEAQPKGVVGGRAAEDLAREVEAVLRARGATPEPDGVLAATAAWFLKETAEGRTHTSGDGQAVARRLGFAGNLVTMATASTDGAQAGLWRQSLAEVPVNLPVTRYGVRVSPAGISAVALGTVEAKLAPFPRHLAPGESLQLRGEIAPRFERAIVYLTGVDGKVEDRPQRGRHVEVSLALAGRGVYQAEVMGDGPSGPVVLVNVPVYVGVPEPDLGAPPVLSARVPAAAEARLLVLLNEARTKAGLRSLSVDSELRAVALGHCEDMAGNHFLGHVSPTTGTPEDRIKHAGVLVLAGGENIARAATADEAHGDLMNSPGHRANMVSPQFTHVGIAVVHDGEQILATLVFGRRPDLAAPAPSAAEAMASIAKGRRAKGLPPAQEDPVLRAGAAAGAKAFARGGADAAFAAAQAAVTSEVRKRGVDRQAGCVRLFEVLDRDQIGGLPTVLGPHLRRVGVGVATRTDGKTTWLEVLILTEGLACKE